MVRDPKAVALSRLHREPDDFFKVFNMEARRNILLDFRSRFHAYISSWRQSIENYWKLKDALGDNIKLIYYEDFCLDFESQIRDVSWFFGIDFSEMVLKWHEMPHHDKNGELVRDLKYEDVDVFNNQRYDSEMPFELNEAIGLIKWQYNLWKDRRL